MPFLKGISNNYQFQINHWTFEIRNLKFQSAFTLIELLIVITILGVLASLTLASYGGAQAKARDGVRKSDLAQVKRALELAKSDCEGNAYYPWMGSGDPLPQSQTDYSNLSGYLSNPNLKYLSSVIKDPKDVGPQKYSYFTESGFTRADVCPDTSGGFTQSGADNFVLAVQLERQTDKDAADSRTKCVGKPGNAIWNASGFYFYVTCNN